jgi:signal peptidase I
MVRFIRVTGESLSPEYREGDFVLITKIPFFLKKIKEGDIIVFEHALYGIMIKRVDRVVLEGNEIYVVGTHIHSVDSRQFGPIRKEAVIGKVIWHIRRPL